MRRTQRVLILLTVLIGAQLVAEEIQLRDGTKITGTLVSMSGETFGVTTAYGDIKVPRSDVVSITFPENQPKNADDKRLAVCHQSMSHSLVPNTRIARGVFR